MWEVGEADGKMWPRSPIMILRVPGCVNVPEPGPALPMLDGSYLFALLCPLFFCPNTLFSYTKRSCRMTDSQVQNVFAYGAPADSGDQMARLI